MAEQVTGIQKDYSIFVLMDIAYFADIYVK